MRPTPLGIIFLGLSLLVCLSLAATATSDRLSRMVKSDLQATTAKPTTTKPTTTKPTTTKPTTTKPTTTKPTTTKPTTTKPKSTGKPVVLPANNPDLKNLTSQLSEIDKTKKEAMDNFAYCYQDRYWRGSRMADCPAGFTNDGATCRRPTDDYSNPSRMADCPSGYSNTGATCYRGPDSYSKCCTIGKLTNCHCRDGYTDTGCTCQRWADTKGMDSMTCHAGEFRSGGRCYKNCREGYTSTGEFCHRPLVVTGLDSMFCSNSTEQKIGGRCYPACKAGFRGDTDWCMSCPTGWTNCGLSCDRNGTKGCVEKIGLNILNGVLAAGSIAAIIASGGAAAPATAAANAAKWSASIAKATKLIAKINKFQEAYEKFEAVYEVGSVAANIGETAASDSTKYFKLVTIANQLIGLLGLADPTGLFSMAKDMMAPKCDRMDDD
eukprot:TRINITY_DN6257_c0_g1_i1.p1 TRINITY_DN6257_c0_g1~~TRINITY_DN6257_c0_g1_i1.p1  ORF type:complete len:457 (+),score=147.73 TRINITY_DN6257_c0_g1_i1:64-1371(+)